MPRVTCPECEGTFSFSPGAEGTVTDRGLGTPPGDCLAPEEVPCASQRRAAEEFMEAIRGAGEDRAARTPVL